MSGAGLCIASKKLVGDSEIWGWWMKQVDVLLKLLWEGLTNQSRAATSA